MRTFQEFNNKYLKYLEEGHHGLTIQIPSIVSYLDQIFEDLIKIKGFKYEQIKIKYGMGNVYTNLEELIPLIGRIVTSEMQDKINFILKVEYEIETRLKSLNLNKNGEKL